MIEKNLLSYEQVCLLPQYSVVKSRSECDTSYTDPVTGLLFKIPVIPANMKCCIDTSLARWMSENQYFYSMHRFGDNFEFVRLANYENWRFISISIGVKDEDYALLNRINSIGLRVDCITVDIAHGHSVLMWEMLQFINLIFSGKRVLVIGGNVCTPQACLDLKSWGADMVKVGIAQGGACTTYGKTGFGTPMFSTVLECSATGVPIIADGGIKTNGDFSKSFVAGARLTMAGSMFASCIDSPAESVYDDAWRQHTPYGGGRISAEYALELKRKYAKVIKKIYFGSASIFNKGTTHHIEGKKVELECNDMKYGQKLIEIQEDLQSGISYSGGNTMKYFSGTEWRIKE